jgi:hypothetical protein
MTFASALARGSHRRPEDGVCVLELSSMLAGAYFSDRPPGVSLTVAAFVRGYNDGLDDRLRQDLRPLAAQLLGSAADQRTEAVRAELFRRRLRALYGRRVTWGRASSAPQRWLEVTGYRAGRFATADRTGRRHLETLRLISELLLMGRPPAADAAPRELEPVRPGARPGRLARDPHPAPAARAPTQVELAAGPA